MAFLLKQALKPLILVYNIFELSLELRHLLRLPQFILCLIDYSLGSLGVVERLQRLVQIITSRREVDDHEGLGVTPKRVLHEHGELIRAVWDVFLAFGGVRCRELLDDVKQGAQARVDGLGLLQLVMGWIRLGHPF